MKKLVKKKTTEEFSNVRNSTLLSFHIILYFFIYIFSSFHQNYKMNKNDVYVGRVIYVSLEAAVPSDVLQNRCSYETFKNTFFTEHLRWRLL